jgi:hypothetical protein
VGRSWGLGSFDCSSFSLALLLEVATFEFFQCFSTFQHVCVCACVCVRVRVCVYVCIIHP